MGVLKDSYLILQSNENNSVNKNKERTQFEDSSIKQGGTYIKKYKVGRSGLPDHARGSLLFQPYRHAPIRIVYR